MPTAAIPPDEPDCGHRGGPHGHGIALTLARAGHDVLVQDPIEAARASLGARITDSLTGLGVADPAPIVARVQAAETIAEAVAEADVIFEAAPEKLPLKKALFSEVEVHAPREAILASNTSVIPITKIMDHLAYKDRALGTHWWNPPHMIPLVEVIRTEWTQDAAMDQMMALLGAAGKTPVRVEKDVPGFIGNRLQHALWREAVSLVENGICSAEAVDDVVKASFGRRLAVLGPLENADLVGIELTQDIHDQVLFDLEATPKPSPHLQTLLDQGRSGMAAGAGFRDWAPGEIDQVKARVAAHLRKLEGILPDES